MIQVDKKKYPLVHELSPCNRPGVYGVFSKKGKDKNICQYIGESWDLFRRCYKDHQKPSQFLLARLVLGKHGFDSWGPRYQGKFPTYSEYAQKAREVREEIEFRFLDSDIHKEYDYINKMKPVYNIRK